MLYIKPYYYDQFRCSGGTCPESCCEGWQIVIDEESLSKYERTVGPIGSRLANSIDWEEGTFFQYAGRCAFLNDENLCDLQCELGEDALCMTCKRYPRHVEEYEDIRELSLSLSCPAAARMMLTDTCKLTFVEVETDEEETEEDFDYLLFTKLTDAREAAYAIAQNRCWRLGLRLEALLCFAKELQECLDEERLFDMDDVIEKYQKAAEHEIAPDFVRLPDADMFFCREKEQFQILYKLEHLHKDWKQTLDEAYACLFSGTEADYWKYMTLAPELETAGEQLLMFFIYTYFCGAVYDDWIYSKMALAVQSVRWIFELYAAERKQNGTTRPSLDALIRVSWRYAREAEHSDFNLNYLEEQLNHYLILSLQNSTIKYSL